MDRLTHWEQVYRTKEPDQVSWFQADARLSREMIVGAVPDRTASIIDIGAGASTLADGLLGAGYRHLTVMDLSSAALELAKVRLGPLASSVTWQTADVLTAALPAQAFDVWHDRAVFHFLTDPVDRTRYVAQVCHAVRPGGIVLVATFAEDGPLRCSGLEVARYSAAELHAQFGPAFTVLTSDRELHTTPSGATQSFTYCVLQLERAGQVTVGV